MLKVKGTVSEVQIKKDDYNNNYIEGIIDVPRASGLIDKVFFRAIYEDETYVALKDSQVSNTKKIFTGSLRTYPTGEEYPRYRTKMYLRDIEIENPQTEDDLNEFTGWVEVLNVGDIRQTPNGMSILDITVFCKRKSGMKDKLSMVCFDRTAQFCSKRLKPGDTVKVCGRFQSRDYAKVVGIEETVDVTINELICSYVCGFPEE